MLRASIQRAARPALRPIAPAVRPQWAARARFYADEKKPGGQLDETVIPNPAPVVTPSNPTIPPSEVPLEPPTAQTASTTAPNSAQNSAPAPSRAAPVEQPAPTPPTGTGSARVAPSPQAPKPKKKRRIRRALWWLTVLTALGYAGGTYYSLVNDEFHDYFTEYVPFGEDAVGYFEEREFKRRFPAQVNRLREQLIGERKVTIPGKSGVDARLAQENEGPKAPYMSAVQDKAESDVPRVGSNEPAKGVQERKKEARETTKSATTEDLLPKATKESAVAVEEKPAKVVAPVDHLAVPEAGEPVVQDVVKIVNDLITMVNADASHGGQYTSALEKAKSELGKVVSDISLLKASAEKSAEEKIQAIHREYDEAARSLIQRLEMDRHEQEAHWKEEYENERERLSQSYKEKLAAELAAADKVYEEKLKNKLLEQSIALQRQFSATVRERVEAEREGRLGKLNELSNSVQELEKLTAEWNAVVDANLKTQHLVVAVEAVKSAIENQVVPKPFITELAALKEIAANDPIINAAIASINPVAYQRGIPNAGQLIDRFRRVASEVRKAALLPEDAGVASHLASLAMSKVMFKKAGLAVGQDVEAVLARTEVLLEEGDLDGAAREMNSLQGWAKVLSKDWLSDCRRVLEVKQALDVIQTEARLQTLLVD